MNRITLLLTGLLLLAVSCREEDNRYFAPEIEFGTEAYTVPSESGGLDVNLLFSRPAQEAFDIRLSVSGSLEEPSQYRLSAREVAVKAGDTQALVHVDLYDDAIWNEDSWIEMVIMPGTRYTVNPAGKCQTRIHVTKEIVLPSLRLIAPENPLRTNPYWGETLHFEIAADRPPVSDLTVDLGFGDLVYGADYRIVDADAPAVPFPAGAEKVAFDLQILKKDISGYDRHVDLAVLLKQGAYVVDSGASSVDVHLSDPVVNCAPLWKTPAPNDGVGYQVRQGIQGPDGAWDGNTVVNLYVSSEGSNYIRSYRNMYMSQWLCLANAVGSNALRLTDFFPNLLYPNEIIILDYGSAGNTRTFSPVDSLFRLVLDKDATDRGTITLASPRTFIARTGSRLEWEAGTNPSKTWQLDSKATGGQLLESQSPVLTGWITVTLAALEGRFDFSDTSEPLLFTAWFRSDSPEFMKDVDLTKYAVEQDGDLWKVRYKLWPR